MEADCLPRESPPAQLGALGPVKLTT